MPRRLVAPFLVLAASAVSATPAAALDLSARIPDGTVQCSFSAWSTDKDPKGLNVRDAPNGKVILGTLKYDEGDEFGPFVEMKVQGFKDGWFLIDTTRDEVEAAAEPERPVPQVRGWVHGSKLGGQLLGLNGGFRDKPDPDAKGKPVKDADSIVVKRIVACRGEMVKVETDRGSGWVYGLCSNQLTTCP